MELYRDIAVLGVKGKATIRPGHTHRTTWQGHDIDHDTVGLCAGHAIARSSARPSQWVCHDTNFVSWLGAAFVSQYGCDIGCDTTTVRHYTTLRATTHTEARDTAPAHGLSAGCVAIQPMTRPAM